MKVYRSVTFDLDGNVVSEDSYEYEGPISKCKGGDSASVEYQQSPAQANIYWQAFQPLKTLWGDDGRKFHREMAWRLLPSKSYFSQIPDELMGAAWEPYHQGAEQMMGRFGSQNLLGSPSTSMSPAGGEAMGEYYADAAQQVGMDTWNMGASYRNSLMLPYTSAVSAIGGTYPDAVVDQGSSSNPGGAAIMGAAGGAGLGYMIGGPWGAGIGAGAGGLAGWLGG